MRRPVKNRIQPGPDELYGSVKVSKLINYVMERGKKDTARKIVYKVLEELKRDGDPVALLEQALDNASPTVEVRSRRVGGANYQVPREVSPNRKLSLGMRWIVEADERITPHRAQSGNKRRGRSRHQERNDSPHGRGQ